MADYRDEIPDETAAFIERVADHLRAAERLDPSFDERLMQGVRLEARPLYAPKKPRSASWWRTERMVRLSPLGAIAMAAGISIVVALSTVAVGSRSWARFGASAVVTRSAASPVRTDTVNVVRFVFEDSNARSVQLVGDFNEWTRGATNLKLSGAAGVWAVSVPLRTGRHEYAFIVDGTRWIADPLAIRSSDDFDTESSVIQVGPSAQSTT